MPDTDSFNHAAAIAQAGGLIIYQTETFAAIGCRADSPDAVAAIFRIKSRKPHMPLPLIAACMEQIASLADIACMPAVLAHEFWPGPLSVLLPARQALPAGLVNSSGKVCVRISGHAVARELARKCGMAIVASSANLHGQAPAVRPADADAHLLYSCQNCGLPFAALHGPAMGQFTMPSTIVEPLRANNGWRINIVRQGAIKTEKIEAALAWEQAGKGCESANPF